MDLAELIDSLWGELLGGQPVECPVCGGEMVPVHLGPGGVVGRCIECGASLD